MHLPFQLHLCLYNFKLKFVYHTRKLEAIPWNINFLLGPFFCVAMLGGTYNVNDFDFRFRTNVYKDIVFNQSNIQSNVYR